VSGPSSYIANAHNERYAFYTGKGDLKKKNAVANKGVLACSPDDLRSNED